MMAKMFPDANVVDNGNQLLIEAMQDNDLELFKSFRAPSEQIGDDLKKEILLKPNEENLNVLHMTASFGNMAIAKFLICYQKELKIDLNTASKQGLFPLHVAAARHKPETLQPLFDAKPEVLKIKVKDVPVNLNLAVVSTMGPVIANPEKLKGQEFTDLQKKANATLDKLKELGLKAEDFKDSLVALDSQSINAPLLKSKLKELSK